MKHKVGDKVRIRSLEWYDRNKDEYGDVIVGKQSFVKEMKEYCGMQATITYASEHRYSIDLDNKRWFWTDEMFEETMEQKKTFEPFERVLYKPRKQREHHFEIEWLCGIFSHETEEMYVINGAYWDKKNTDVIPFAGNSHFVGTNDMPEEEVELEEGEYIVMFDELKELTEEPIIICQFKKIDIGCAQVLQFRSRKSFMRNFCIPFSKFNPNDMEETRKHILCVRNGKLVRARV